LHPSSFTRHAFSHPQRTENKLKVSDYTYVVDKVGVDAALVDEVAVGDHAECFPLSVVLLDNLVDVGEHPHRGWLSTRDGW